MYPHLHIGITPYARTSFSTAYFWSLAQGHPSKVRPLLPPRRCEDKFGINSLLHNIAEMLEPVLTAALTSSNPILGPTSRWDAKLTLKVAIFIAILHGLETLTKGPSFRHLGVP